MEQEISLLDLLAAAVRKGKQIIIFAIIVGLLFMGYSILQANSAKSEEEESYTMAEKERQLRDLQKTVERAQKGIDAEREYIRDSLYMDLNPYNVYSTRIGYLVTNVEVPLDGSLGMMANPTSYAINCIVAEYLLEWNSQDLQETLNVPGYQNVEEKYLRELIGVSDDESGSITISVNASSEQEAQKLAQAAERIILSFTKRISSNAYGHTLTKISTKTRQIISSSIKDGQNIHYDSIDKYIDDLSEAQKTINKIESGHTSTGYIKKLIIGCFVGGMLAVLWVMFHSIVRGLVESTDQVRNQTGLKYLGSAVSGKEKSIFANLASIITNEKKWNSNDDALAYFAERTSMEDRRMILVTTTGTIADTGKIESLLQVLNNVGTNAEFLPGINSNAEALAALKTCDSVLFAVEKSKTAVPDILAAKQLVEQSGKTALGYVML